MVIDEIFKKIIFEFVDDIKCHSDPLGLFVCLFSNIVCEKYCKHSNY